MELKALTIDFWNTLYDSSNGMERNHFRQEALLKEAEKLDKKITIEDLQRAIQSSWGNFEKYWKEHHRTPPCRETVEFIWEELDLPNEEESILNIVKAFEDSLFAHPPRLIQGVDEIIPVLSENFKLSIVSDTGFSPGTHLKKLMDDDGILKYFSAHSYSNETGVSKPHKKAFETVLNELKTDSKNALHIGDIERTDIVGAHNMGMYSILFKGSLSKINQENPQTSKAHFQAEHWKEIREILVD